MPVIPGTWEAVIRRSWFEAMPGKKKLARLHVKNNKNQKDWGCGSSGRA
jgi:hypothetical protein